MASVAARPRRPGCAGKPDEIIAPPEPGLEHPAPTALATDKELSDFLKSVEKRAFKRTALCRARRRCRAGHRAGRDDPAGGKVRRPPGRRVAAAVPAHPVERDDGLVPPPEGAQRGGAELLGLRDPPATTATSTCWRRWRSPDGHAGHRKRRRHRVTGPDPAIDRGARSTACPRVNGKPSCCVTGRNSMSPRRRPSWAVRRAVSRRTAPGRCMRWRRP